MYTILGFSKFNSKAGKPCVVIQLQRDFNSRELTSGSFGVRVEEVFLPDHLLTVAIKENLGKKCNLFYNRNGYLEDISIS